MTSYRNPVVLARAPPPCCCRVLGHAGTTPATAAKDRDLLGETIAKAKAAGFTALALTVDLTWYGNRERDVRNGFTIPPDYSARQVVEAIKRPAWTWDFISNDPCVTMTMMTMTMVMMMMMMMLMMMMMNVGLHLERSVRGGDDGDDGDDGDGGDGDGDDDDGGGDDDDDGRGTSPRTRTARRAAAPRRDGPFDLAHPTCRCGAPPSPIHHPGGARGRKRPPNAAPSLPALCPRRRRRSLPVVAAPQAHALESARVFGRDTQL